MHWRVEHLLSLSVTYIALSTILVVGSPDRRVPPRLARTMDELRWRVEVTPSGPFVQLTSATDLKNCIRRQVVARGVPHFRKSFPLFEIDGVKLVVYSLHRWPFPASYFKERLITLEGTIHHTGPYYSPLVDPDGPNSQLLLPDYFRSILNNNISKGTPRRWLRRHVYEGYFFILPTRVVFEDIANEYHLRVSEITFEHRMSKSGLIRVIPSTELRSDEFPEEP